jgi:hypothetical protein
MTQKYVFTIIFMVIAEVFTYWRDEAASRGLKSVPPPPTSASELAPPPAAWAEVYARLAREMGFEADMAAGYCLLQETLAKIFTGKS